MHADPRHHAAVRTLAPELRALNELSHAAAHGPSDVDDLLDRVCAAIVESFGFTRVAVFRLADGGLLEPLASRGIPIGDLPRGVRTEDQPLFARAAESREPVFVADVSTDAALDPALAHEYGVQSALAVPLVYEGRTLGFVAADRGGEPFALEDETLDILATIGAIASVFLERALEARELRRLNDVARTFAAMASHELRTPAAVVHGMAATLHLRGDLLTEDQRADLRRALYEQTDRLRVLVDQLLDLSRLEAKAIEIRPERFPVRRRVEELLLTAAADRRDDVDVRIDPDVIALADPDAFDRVVSNLVANALRYGRPPVSVSARETDRHFRLSVEDHGDGVPAEFVPKLFDRFARSDSSRASSVGAGLGLAIAQQFAQAHGGELLYRRADPHGACFELVLPRDLDGAEA